MDTDAVQRMPFNIQRSTFNAEQFSLSILPHKHCLWGILASRWNSSVNDGAFWRTFVRCLTANCASEPRKDDCQQEGTDLDCLAGGTKRD